MDDLYEQDQPAHRLPSEPVDFTPKLSPPPRRRPPTLLGDVPIWARFLIVAVLVWVLFAIWAVLSGWVPLAMLAPLTVVTGLSIIIAGVLMAVAYRTDDTD